MSNQLINIMNFIPRGQRLSVDLGTANTLVYSFEQKTGLSKVVINAPSCVAIHDNNRGAKKVIAIGLEAKNMQGRTPKNIKVVRPLKNGVIANFEIAKEMLQYFIRKVHEHKYLRLSPSILICVPSGATQVERRAIRESALDAGAKEVYLIEEPMAAAMGAGLPVHEANGSMVIDIGGGTTEVAIVSLNGIVYADSLRVGGDSFDEAIVNYVRRHHGILIGEGTAEKIKKKLGNAFPSEAIITLEVQGRHVAEGVPRSFILNNSEVLEALQEPLSSIVDHARRALEKAPPELSADIAQSGIVLTGGGALLRDLNWLLMEKTGLPVVVAQDPLTCVARGGAQALTFIDRFQGDFLG